MALHFKIALSRLLIQDHEPPMYWPHIEALTDGTTIDQRPIEISQILGTPYWRVRNGRHRMIAAMILGHQEILAKLHEGGPENEPASNLEAGTETQGRTETQAGTETDRAPEYWAIPKQWRHQ